MNAERKQAFAVAFQDARQRASADYRLILDKDQLYKPLLSFLRGEDCQHVQTLCDRVASNGRHMFYYFCCQCGARLSKFVPYKSLSVPQKLTAYSGDYYDAMRKVRYTCSAEMGRYWADHWWAAYNAYLQSDQWRDLREQVLYRDGFECQLNLDGCTHAASQVHHLTYERVTRELLSDLISVCQACHEQHHERPFYEEPYAE